MMERTVHGPYGELIKSPEWNGFKSGDIVSVDSRYVSDRVAWMRNWSWEFVAFVTNIKTGHQWVELYGGHVKWAHTVGVSPEAVVKVDSRRRK
jgi:hypothetical protein